MTRESLGYTYTVWTCPSCGTRNLGPRKTCSGCGAAQPEDVKFEQAAEEKLITDEAEIAAAKAGPDIHCPYCGTRNAAGSTKCSQCGGDLTEGSARQAGAVLGGQRTEPAPPVTCPSCGNQNPADSPNCKHCGAPLYTGASQAEAANTPSPGRNKGCRTGLIVLALVVLAIIIISVIRCRPIQVVGEVSGVYWQRSIPVYAQREVEYQDWKEDLPAGAQVISCGLRESGYQDAPAANATKVCGTPYSVDLGNGRAEVVQDCSYLVYKEFCRYSIVEWVVVNTLVAEGQDYSPVWPRANLAPGQREGERAEKYVVTFVSDGRQYTYTTRDERVLQLCQPNTRWQLTVSGGIVTNITPG